MTEKIYYQDAYCKKFEGIVISCQERKKGYAVILDRTAFYPEGGGQPGDRGILYVKQESGEEVFVQVTDTHEKDGEILHYTEHSLPIGSLVRGEIDWEYRFDLMQNHSGEHIVSGLIHEAYGYQNVGFHMGKDVLTIDLSGELTKEQLSEIERKANEIVWLDKETEIVSYSEEEVKEIAYRSKKELHGTVRIVTFPDADVCACCGTHVKRSGEIGIIKLLSQEKFKGGVRLEMVCGRRAYRYFCDISNQNQQISVELSAKPLETAMAVKHLKTLEREAAFRAGKLESQLVTQIAEKLQNAGDVFLIEETMGAESVRRLASAITETCNGRCAVFAGKDGDGYKYAFGHNEGDLRELVRVCNQELHGKGGGKPFFVQGSVTASQNEIEEFLKKEGFYRV